MKRVLLLADDRDRNEAKFRAPIARIGMQSNEVLCIDNAVVRQHVSVTLDTRQRYTLFRAELLQVGIVTVATIRLLDGGRGIWRSAGYSF